MSSKTKSILAGAVVILILSVLLIVLLQTPDQGITDIENVSSSYSNEDYSQLQLISKDANLIESVTVKNKSDEYVIEKLEENVWGIDELNNFNLITNFSSMLKTVSSFSAVAIIEEDASDLSKYGFDTPNIVIDVVFSDSKTYQIKVGEISNQLNVAYVIVDDNSTVYKFFPSTFSEFLLSTKSFISTNVIGALPTYDYGTADPDFTYMKLERHDLKTPWVFEKYSPKTNIMLTIPAYLEFTSPVACDVDAEQFPKYFENYFGLSALSVDAYTPTVEELTEYGFDEPYARFTTVYGGGEMEFTLVVGNEIPTQGFNCRYLMHEGTDLVYIIETSYLPFLTVQSDDILSSMLVLESLYGYSEIDVNVQGTTINLEIWQEDNVVVQADDGSYVYEDNVLFVNLNGKESSTELYKLYIQTLFLTSVVDMTDYRPTGSADLSIKYTYTDGTVETVEAYIQADRTTILILNGTDYFTGRSGYVENVATQTQLMLEQFNY